MSGTKLGGKKAAAKNLARDPEFYSRIGKIGGTRGHSGGFASQTQCNCNILSFQHTKPQCAGKIGGMRSRRRKAVQL